MGRIAGYYEWDDDDLTPGRKKEGGLHQNLFDSEGKLRSSARFVPMTGHQNGTVTVTETVYVHVEHRRRTREQEALEETINELVSLLINRGIERLRPVAKRWWDETVSPAVGRARARKVRGHARQRAEKADSVVTFETPLDPPVVSEEAPMMSSAEAQARVVAALAARAFSDEQLALVASARIVDSPAGLDAVREALAALPTHQLEELIQDMARNPAMLGEDALAELARRLERYGRALPR